MTFKESIPLAKKLAENALNKGFDVEAFLVLSAIQDLDVHEDLVPSSNVDEGFQHILELFVSYMRNRDTLTYKTLLNTLRQILSELYHTTDSQEQKALFKEFVNKLTLIN